MEWIAYRRVLEPRRATAARRDLAERFSAATVEHPELARAVGAQLRHEPLYAVVPYKEAFSPAVVRGILDVTGVQSGKLLDPFAGAGTSLLVGAERRLTAVGLDVLPFSAFTASTLLHAPSLRPDTLDSHLAGVLNHPKRRRGSFPDFPVRSWAFTPAALAELSDLHAAVQALPDGIERDVLRLALLCSVERASQATKDGTSLRRRPHGRGRPGRFGTRRTRADVQALFCSKVALLRDGAADQPLAPNGSTAVVGDARTLPGALPETGFDVAVCSPPYPNRYDYVGNYQLELGFGFIGSADHLRELRKRQLRSHLEAPWTPERTLELAALDEFLAAYLASDLSGQESGRVFRMVCGYFEDMSLVLAGLHSVMRPGAIVALVVGTQVFGGEPLPTDLLLAEIAELHGFDVKELWVARTKGMSVQQRQRAEQLVPSRETVLLLAA